LKAKLSNLELGISSQVVQHYGYKYNYETHNIDEKCNEIPDFLNKYKEYLTNICLELNLIDTNYIFNQCIINNYYPKQGISTHIDNKNYGDVIGCFTIGSGTTIIFKNNNEKYNIYVNPNSLIKK